MHTTRSFSSGCLILHDLNDGSQTPLEGLTARCTIDPQSADKLFKALALKVAGRRTSGSVRRMFSKTVDLDGAPSPLTLAVWARQGDVIAVLLKLGADPTVCDVTGRPGYDWALLQHRFAVMSQQQWQVCDRGLTAVLGYREAMLLLLLSRVCTCVRDVRLLSAMALVQTTVSRNQDDLSTLRQLIEAQEDLLLRHARAQTLAHQKLQQVTLPSASGFSLSDGSCADVTKAHRHDAGSQPSEDPEDAAFALAHRLVERQRLLAATDTTTTVDGDLVHPDAVAAASKNARRRSSSNGRRY